PPPRRPSPPLPEPSSAASGCLPIACARRCAALRAVGLAERAGHRPSALSGGQQQRVALARALVTRPDVLFADEPTGALDTRTSGEVLRLLRRLVDEQAQTTIMVTHDPTAAAVADTVVFLQDGRIADRLDLDGDTARSAAAVAARMARLEA
ncbi:ATP-binding cassette domain-containing protein, partial [Kitasatospora sp. NPDC004799]|uniref:ABC transporter ATP-binding protein n=1 Tax=Kitasatospora sp. NPDC004799 TaxID=3154460 RepID=UPI0033AD1DF0